MKDTPNRLQLLRTLLDLEDLLSSENYNPGLMTWQDAYRQKCAELMDFLGTDADH